MAHSSDIPNQDQEELRQLLWDYVFGLLDAVDAVRIKRQISSDPLVARLYIEAKMQSDLVGAAASYPHPDIELHADLPQEVSPPAEHAAAPVPPSRQPAAEPSSGVHPSPARAKWRWLNILIYSSAAVLLLGIGVCFFQPSSDVRASAVKRRLEELRRTHVYTFVTSSDRLHPGIANKIALQTVGMDENARSAKFEYRIRDAKNIILFERAGETDSQGRLLLTVPGNAVARATEFELVTKHSHGATSIRGPITVDEAGESVYLSLDRPIYRQGEVVRFRGVVLSRFGLRSRREKGIEFDVRDSKGQLIPQSLNSGVTRRGVGFGEFQLPRDLPVGRYDLCARSPSGEFREQRHTFYVQSQTKPKFRKQLELTRPSYQPGDQVVADFALQHPDGRPVTKAALNVKAIVDGVEIHSEAALSDEYGTAQVRFALPERIKRGAGQLSVAIAQRGLNERIVRAIPIRLNRIVIQCFPEGGELVPGVPSRVYFSSTDSLGQPVAVAGELLDAEGRVLTNFKTIHRGRGKFRFTPPTAAASRPYAVRLSTGDDKVQLNFPKVDSSAFLVVDAHGGVVEPKMPLELTLRSARQRAAIGINVACRGVTVGQSTVTIEPAKESESRRSQQAEQQRVLIPLADEASGIIRVTAFDYSETPPLPVAERLLFRRPQEKLITQISRPNSFMPGRRAQVDLRITDEQKRPVNQAVLGVTIVDRNAWTRSGKSPGDIRSHFLLHNELQLRTDLSQEINYLTNTASSNEWLDLLLGTKGWRRFIHKPTPKQLASATIHRENRTAAPVVFNNRNRVYLSLVSAIDAFQSQRESNVRQLGLVVAVPAAGVVLLIMIQMVMLRSQRAYLRTALVGLASVGCLITGICWASARVNPDGNLRLLAAFAPTGKTNNTTRKASIGEPKTPPEVAHESSLWSKEETRPTTRQMAPWTFSPSLVDLTTTKVFERLADRRWHVTPAPSRLWRKKSVTANPVQTANLSRLQKQLRTALLGADEQRIVELSARISKAIADNQFPVRSYAHRFANHKESQLVDTTQTLYWNPIVLTDKEGRASLTFDLSELQGDWLVLIDGHANGRLASAQAEVESSLPFEIAGSLPNRVTVGDKFQVPIRLKNATAHPLSLQLITSMPKSFHQKNGSTESIHLAPSANLVRFREIEVRDSAFASKSMIEIAAQGGRIRAKVSEKLNVLARGYPNHRTIAGTFAGRRDILFALPDKTLPNSLRLTLTVFPSFESALQRDAESLIRGPRVGMEALVAAAYSQAVAFSRRESRVLPSPRQTRTQKQTLASHYRSLLHFEHPQQGFYALRAKQPHPVYTALGLLHLRDLRRVWDVDQTVLNRNSRWLFGNSNQGQPFYQPATSAVAIPRDLGNAFIIWVLSEMKPEGLSVDRQLGQIVRQAESTNDPYLLALAATSASNFEQRVVANRLVESLAKTQHQDGYVVATQGTITRSGGSSMKVETTALAAMAWMRNAGTRENAERALKWIKSQRQPQGGFGTSQATALALRAMSQFEESDARQPRYMGMIEVFSRGRRLRRLPIRSRQRTPLTIALSPQEFSMGDQQLSLRATGPSGELKKELSFTFHIKYQTERAAVPPCPVELVTSLSNKRLRLGQTTDLILQLKNQTNTVQPMTVARVGLPGGLEPSEAALIDLKKSGLVDHIQLDEQGLLLAWESVPRSSESIESLKIPLTARISGEFTGAPSQCFLNYHRELFRWSAPLKVSISN